MCVCVCVCVKSTDMINTGKNIRTQTEIREKSSGCLSPVSPLLVMVLACKSLSVELGEWRSAQCAPPVIHKVLGSNPAFSTKHAT